MHGSILACRRTRSTSRSKALTRDRAAMVPLAANREVLELLLDGIAVEYRDADGAMTKERVRVVDWRDGAQQLHPRLANLVFRRIAHAADRSDRLRQRRAAADDRTEGGTSSGRGRLSRQHQGLSRHDPANFRPNGFVLLSNGLDARLGATAFASWETYKEWKRIDDETEPGRVSLETAIRAAATPERLLDLVENFLALRRRPRRASKGRSRKNHQLLGVNHAIGAVEQLGENRGRLGVFWHTQGAGKSLSMMIFARRCCGGYRATGHS